MLSRLAELLGTAIRPLRHRLDILNMAAQGPEGCLHQRVNSCTASTQTSPRTHGRMQGTCAMAWRTAERISSAAGICHHPQQALCEPEQHMEAAYQHLRVVCGP